MFGKLAAKTVPVAQLTESDKRTLYGLMQNYYEDVRWEIFRQDLHNKQDAILIFDRKTDEIKGFSTLMLLELEIDGSPMQVVFSGDTVLDRCCWGSRLLGRHFLAYLLRKKLKKPMTPLYWLLISKGYRTYLMLANNFREHYPRFERETPPEIQAQMDYIATHLFQNNYDAKTGRCRFPYPAGRLRADIAPLTESMVSRSPRLRFFLEKNPEWEKGVELVCIAKMSWTMPLYYLIKSWWKRYAAVIDRAVKERMDNEKLLEKKYRRSGSQDQVVQKINGFKMIRERKI